jgi:hypothetical protein
VAVVGGLAYVADHNTGLRIISVADPAHPVEVGYCDTPGQAYEGALSGDYVYVADYTAGLRVISVADPAHPVEVGYWNATHAVHGVAVSGRYAYIADRDRGLRVMSIADPAHPTEVGYYDTPGLAFGVTLAGGLVFVGDYTAGLKVFQFYGGGVEETPNAEVRAAKCAPSIARGVLFLPEASSRKPQAASLHDISGRKVLDLRPGANDVGRLGAGVYFVRELSAVSCRPSAVPVRNIIISK